MDGGDEGGNGDSLGGSGTGFSAVDLIGARGLRFGRFASSILVGAR